MENLGIDPGTSHMLSERSITLANFPSFITCVNSTKGRIPFHITLPSVLLL